MKPTKRWIWLTLGAVGLLALASRRRRRGASLGSPVEARAVPTTTPHGYFGAHRDGPPIHAHQGIDLAAPPGSRVLAVGDGTIVRAEPGLGKIVRKLRLDAPGAWETGASPVDAIVYADLGTPLVEPGERVRKGDAIAVVAPAGFVHFAVKEKRTTGETFVDPRVAGFAYRSTKPGVA